MTNTYYKSGVENVLSWVMAEVQEKDFWPVFSNSEENISYRYAVMFCIALQVVKKI